MSLARQISEWKEYPNSLGSEARAAVLVADVASELGEPVPRPVTQALRQLALRGTLRDLAVELRGDQLRVSSVDFDDVAAVAAAASGISWTEAITVIVGYLNRATAARKRRREVPPSPRQR